MPPSGSLNSAVTMKYPDDAFQAVFDEWWIKDVPRRGTFTRGRLVWSPALSIKEVPTELIAEGRKDPRDHGTAKATLRTYHVSRKEDRPVLPVAGMMLHNGEICLAYKAKRRPALILGTPPPTTSSFLKGSPKSHRISPILLAPYYSCAQQGRTGYPPEFLNRVRRAEYPQFMWDLLPIGSDPEGSLLRMDQIQSIGRSVSSCQETEWRLSNQALKIVDQWVSWLLVGVPPAGSELKETREFMLEL